MRVLNSYNITILMTKQIEISTLQLTKPHIHHKQVSEYFHFLCIKTCPFSHLARSPDTDKQVELLIVLLKIGIYTAKQVAHIKLMWIVSVLHPTCPMIVLIIHLITVIIHMSNMPVYE